MAKRIQSAGQQLQAQARILGNGRNKAISSMMDSPGGASP